MTINEQIDILEKALIRDREMSDRIKELEDELNSIRRNLHHHRHECGGPWSVRSRLRVAQEVAAKVAAGGRIVGVSAGLSRPDLILPGVVVKRTPARVTVLLTDFGEVVFDRKARRDCGQPGMSRGLNQYLRLTDEDLLIR